MDRVKDELSRLKHAYDELQAAYRDNTDANSRLSEDVRIRDEKIETQLRQLRDMEELVKAKEAHIQDKLLAITALKQKIANSDHTLAEGKQVIEVIEKNYRQQLEDRNRLLMKVQTAIATVLSEDHRLPGALDAIKPEGNNFHVFADVLLEKINLVSKIMARFENRIKTTETRMQEEFRSLNAKLERKISQLEKFESIIREVAEVQKSLKRTIRTKQQELSSAKVTISSLEHEISVQKHHISTLQSASAVFSSSEKAKLLDAQAKIAELERSIKQKEVKIKEEQQRQRDVGDSLAREKSHAHRQIEDLTEEARYACHISSYFIACCRKYKREVESTKLKNQQLEKLLESYKRSLEETTHNTSTLRKASVTQGVMDASDNALVAMNNRLKDELDVQRRSLENERKRALEREEQYLRLKNDYQRVKRRLQKRETMIEIALSKLEMVNSRKDQAEMNLVSQFADDVRNMMKRTESDDIYKSLESVTVSYRSPTKGE